MDKGYTEYFKRLRGLEIRYDVPMRTMTSFHIGGPATIVVPHSEAELLLALQAADAMGIRPFVLGNGTNMLVRDAGIAEPVLYIGEALSGVERQGSRFTVGAGTLLAFAAKKSVSDGFMGLEWANGIPGSVGGAVAMNAGAYGGEISQVLTGVRYIQDGEIHTRAPLAGELGYRKSEYTAPGRVVTAAEFTLLPDDGTTQARMAEMARQRKEKQPLAYPSAGSVFKRPAGHFAGALIQDAGLKGLRIGGAQVSELHAGFIVNMGGATCGDVLALMAEVQKRVLEKSGVWLEPELKTVGIAGKEAACIS